jgi:hypothetical protein
VYLPSGDIHPRVLGISDDLIVTISKLKVNQLIAGAPPTNAVDKSPDMAVTGILEHHPVLEELNRPFGIDIARPGLSLARYTDHFFYT